MSCLSAMELSPPQLAAVLDARPRVLVAAGAGSGKTRLLVASVVHALVEEALPVERLVAVTFTRKAGAELASRARAALEGCGRPDLARSLDLAVVGTIDSLCRRLVKGHALLAAVDPACAVLEPEAAALVKAEVMRRTWEMAVERADEAQLEVLSSHGEALPKEVLALYERLRGLGQDLPTIAIAPGSSEEWSQSELARLVREALAAGAAVAKPSASLQGDLAKLTGCLAWLERPAAERCGESALRASAGFFPSRMTRLLEPSFEPVRAALTQYRCALAEARLRPLVHTVNDLMADFHSRYTNRKEERGLVDFADLELKARALLTGPGPGGEPALGLPGAFLLVDEFQDTNELQCTILEGLGAARVVMVGDERQSIYRFRGADVEVFRDRKAALASAQGAGTAGGVHRLDVNYRSRPQILDFINRVFGHESYFGEGFVQLEADPAGTPASKGVAGPARAFAPKGVAAPFVRPSFSVEVLVAERHQAEEAETPLASMQQAEAEALAVRVRGLIDDEHWQRRDIVVLLPTQTHVSLYQEALRTCGIDVYVVRGKGYYSQEEVADVTSLLRLLVNPHDDLALISVLRSALVGISDDGLYLLGRERRAARAKSLWEVVRPGTLAALGAEDLEALTRFLERLGEIRSRVGRPGLARLVDDAISACSYDVCLLAAPDGVRRFANVRKLMRLAGEFEAASGPDLAGFVNLIESIGDLSDREGSAPTLAEGEDVVRVMTVHQAKGLEFPVVVLAGLGSDVHRAESSTFAVARDGRMGVFLKGHRRHTYESYEPCWGPAAEIVADEQRREREEDVRLLYVAMTRAQDRLVLVGARPANNASDQSRIGRILGALGVAAFPGGGEVVPVQGLEAVVVGIGPSASGEGAEPSLARLRGEREDGPVREPHRGVGEPHRGAGPPGRRAGEPDRGAGEPGPGAGKPDPGAGKPDPRPRFLDIASPHRVPKRVSFSALAAYQRCPRQYYLERALRLALTAVGPGEEDEGVERTGDDLLDDDEQHAGRDVGILVHALLEKLSTGGPPTADLVRSGAEESLAEIGVRLSAEEFGRAVELTLAFWEWPEAERLAVPTTMREAPFLFAAGETIVSGIMDLICPADDRWRIVDYKTNALKGRSPAELAEAYVLQASVYCLAALRAGAPAVQMDFLFLERPREPVTVRFGPDDVPRLEEDVAEAFAGLMRGSFPTRAGEACGRCSAARVCASMARA